MQCAWTWVVQIIEPFLPFFWDSVWVSQECAVCWSEQHWRSAFRGPVSNGQCFSALSCGTSRILRIRDGCFRRPVPQRSQVGISTAWWIWQCGPRAYGTLGDKFPLETSYDNTMQISGCRSLLSKTRHKYDHIINCWLYIYTNGNFVRVEKFVFINLENITRNYNLFQLSNYFLEST